MVILATTAVVVCAPPAWAVDFEIQEATVEKGEVELEYRGAVFDGQPKLEAEDGEEEESPLEQTHDAELQLSLTDRVMFSVTGTFDEPAREDFRLSVTEIEVQYEIIQRQHFGMSLQFEYEFATIGDTPDELSLAALLEKQSGPIHTTANLFLTSQAGEAVETDAPGFEYALQSKGSVSKRWGIGAEAFGEIEDLSNPGSFDEQEHYVGPMIYYALGGDDDDRDGREGGEDEQGNGEREGPNLSLSFGVLFGVTDVTSDTAFRLNGSLEF